MLKLTVLYLILPTFLCFWKIQTLLKHPFMQELIDHHNAFYIMYGSSFRYIKVMFCDASDCGAVDHYF